MIALGFFLVAAVVVLAACWAACRLIGRGRLDLLALLADSMLGGDRRQW